MFDFGAWCFCFILFSIWLIFVFIVITLAVNELVVWVVGLSEFILGVEIGFLWCGFSGFLWCGFSGFLWCGFSGGFCVFAVGL